MQRRTFAIQLAILCTSAALRGRALPTDTGARIASAARAQVGVTTGYDPTWIHLSYPGGDVPRTTGVCADVVIRALRDSLGLDLQKFVHEDMAAHFDAYPAHKVWGSTRPDTNIDHRRVLNLQTFWQRAGARLWAAPGPVCGDAFPAPLAPGDFVTWLLDARLPHIGVVVSAHAAEASVVHNIGNGAELNDLRAFHAQRAVGHYRWPLV